METEIVESDLELSLSLWGESFSPSQFSDVNFNSQNDPGEIGKSGRYKGKPIPYGAALISFSGRSAMDIDSPLMSLIHSHSSKFREHGASDIEVSLGVFKTEDEQWNWDISSDVMKILSSHKIDLCISVY